MSRSISKVNPVLVHTIRELRRARRAHDAPVWDAVADRLGRARHQVVPVNVGQLNRLGAANEVVVVPGKLLAEGRLTKSLTVGAFEYSAQARAKVVAAGGQALSIDELLKSRPDGTGVRIVA